MKRIDELVSNILEKLEKKRIFKIFSLIIIILQIFSYLTYQIFLQNFLFYYFSTIIILLTWFIVYIAISNPEKAKTYLHKNKREILLDIITILSFGFVEGLILSSLLLLPFTGYHILSQIFFGLLGIILPILILFVKNRELRSGLILSSILALITLQGAVPIFYPKISLIMNNEINYGFVKGDETLASQYADLEIYPPLFPIRFFTQCQNYKIGKIEAIGVKKDLSPISVDKNNDNESIKVCINNADAWTWNKISVPIFLRSAQSFYYGFSPQNHNITDVYNLYTDKKYYYAYLYFSNDNDFEISFQDQTFSIYNGTNAWEALMERNCSFNSFYTEDKIDGFSISNSTIPRYGIEKQQKNNSIELKLTPFRVNKQKDKTIFIIFNFYNCKE